MKRNSKLKKIISQVLVLVLVLAQFQMITPGKAHAGTSPVVSYTSPVVSYTTPVNLAAYVPVSSPIQVTFTDNIVPGSNFTNIAVYEVYSGGSPISISPTISNNVLTITPTVGQFAYNSHYNVLIPAGSVSNTVYSLATDYTFSFHTMPSAPPSPGPATQLVWHTQPGNAQTGANLSPQPVLYLEDAIGNIVTSNSSSVVSLSLTSPTSGTLLGTTSVTLNAGVAAFTNLSVNLAGGYTLTPAINLPSINFAASNTFNITPPVDTTPPTLTSSNPSNGAIGIPVNTTITAAFSKPVNPGPNLSGISLTAGTTVVNITYSMDGSLFINHATALNYSTTYTLNIPAGAVQDLSGNVMAYSYTLQFRTSSSSEIASTSPAAYSTGVNTGIGIDINFLNSIFPASNFGGISITPNGGTVVNYNYFTNGNVLHLTPVGLLGNTTYSVSIPAGAVTYPNYTTNAAYSFSFTTQAVLNAPIGPTGPKMSYIPNYNSNSVTVVDVGTQNVVQTIYGFSQPWAVAVNPNRKAVYVTNTGNNSISIVDSLSNTVVDTIYGISSPWGLALNPVGNTLYATNQNYNTLSVINTATKQVTSIGVGTTPRGVVVSPDSTRVYIANSDSNNVSVVDTATNTVVSTVYVGTNPYGLDITPDGTRVFVTNVNSPVVSVIDTTTNAYYVNNINVGNNNRAIVVSPDGHRVYTANATTGAISIIDASSNSVVGTVYAGTTPNGISVSPDGIFLAVTNYGSNTLSVFDINRQALIGTVPVGSAPSGFGKFIKVLPTVRAYIPNFNNTTVSVIDPFTNTVAGSVYVGSQPYGAAVSPDMTRAYVTNYGSNTVSVLNTLTNNVITTIPVGGKPMGVTVNPQGTRAYVANNSGNSVTLIDTSTNSVASTVYLPVNSNPQGIAVSPGGGRIYTANAGSNSISVINALNNTVENTVYGFFAPYSVIAIGDGSFIYVTNEGANSVSVVDARTLQIVKTVNVSTYPRGLVASRNGTKVYVTNFGYNNVTVIDATYGRNNVLYTIPVGFGPNGIAVTPDNTQIYVANSGDNSVSVIDIFSDTVMPKPIAVGTTPMALGQFISSGYKAALTPPAVKSTLANSNKLKLYYNRILDETSVPAPSDFSVAADFIPIGVTNVSVMGSGIVLTLSTPVTSGQTITLNYTPGVNPVQEIAGQPVGSLTGLYVNTLPGLVSSSFAGVPITGPISIPFNQTISAGSNFNNISLLDSTKLTTVNSTYSINSNSLIVSPLTSLSYGSSYRVIIPAGAVANIQGDATVAESNFSFTTENAPPPPDTTAPGWAGIMLKISNATQTGANLSWAAPIDPDDPVVSYSVYLNGALLGTTTNTFFDVIGLTPNNIYSLSVKAVDSHGNWSTDLGTSFSTSSPSWSIGSLQAAGITPTTLALNWTPAYDSLNPIVAYSVYQNGNPAAVATVAGSVYSCKITGLLPNTAYSFKIEAMNSLGLWSTSGPTVSITTSIFGSSYLESAVRTALNKPSGTITVTDMANLTVLKAVYSSISDLSGLEYAVNLKQLYLGNNQISNLSPLAGLTSLEDLWLDHNQIGDTAISNLSGLTNLKWLYLNHNSISNITPLSNLHNLQVLDLNNNYIADVAPLGGLTSLRGLGLANNTITNISGLSTLINLQSLALQAQYQSQAMYPAPYQITAPKLTDVSAVANMPYLRNLLLNDNNITNLAPLQNLANLKLLTLWNNGITDSVSGGITPLSGLSGLTDLWLDHNNISNVTPLAGLINLQVLSLAGNSNLSNISSLINNAGLGQGDYVYLPSGISPTDVQTLENRYIHVVKR